MPYYDPAKSEIEPPKEAKSHASFKTVVAVCEYLEKADIAMEDARLRPSRFTLGNLVNVMKQLWLRIFTIMEEPIVRRVDVAFSEFALWYRRYSVHPSKRSRVPYYSNEMIQTECNRRLEDIYRTISEGLQAKQWLFKIEERGRQDLKTRMELIEAGVYGDRRKKKPKDNVQPIPGSES